MVVFNVVIITIFKIAFVCNHLEEEEKAGYFAIVVLKMYCYYKCSVAPSRSHGLVCSV